VALGALIAFLTLTLVIQGYMHHLAGISDDGATVGGSASAVPASIAQGGPVIAARGGVRTLAPAQKTIALTFDDGPDPVWTPRILDVLRANHVHATFFVVGEAVIAHPELVRRILEDGNEIGVHTLTHADLGSQPEWRRQLELVGGQQAVIDATGMSASLLRPPYSSENSAVTDDTWTAIQDAAGQGYLTVLSTLDSEDWQRPGVERIVRNATPSGSSGQILLMHDGGGDRGETVAALERLLPELQGRGFRATTVSAATGLSQSMRPATIPERAEAGAFAWTVRISDGVMSVVSWLLLLSGLIMLVRSALVVVVAARHAYTTRRARRAAAVRAPGPVRGGASSPAVVRDPVTVIVPAYNEAAGIEASVRSIAASTHPVEIIVVDDGSTDDTAGIVERMRLPCVRLIRQANAGKPAALNTGLAAASFDLVVMVDGDTVFEPETVARLVQPFADPAIGAVSGNTKVANRRGILGRWQHIEYVVGFNLDRRLFDVAECMPTVPGAVGAFRRSALEAVGGVSDDTLAEDTDLTMSLLRGGWRVVYREDARAWTEVPETLRALWRQRYRWCYGTLQSMFKHRGAIAQGGAAGKLGRRGLTYLLILQVLLPLLAPVVDVFALYGLFFLDPVKIIGLWFAFLLVQTLVAAFAFFLDHESPGPLWTLPLQQVVYRQLMYLVVVQSVFTAFAGRRLRWHRMERYGNLRVPAGDGVPLSN
jgi:cellulose synthase/poly-beta-1,6-N-acetylglucosamine synthase-like glycosyltransferase/peptidoglycan/xylan/chitin deacetylase (PgdA/CDA1 family)